METPRAGSVIDGFTLTERLTSGAMATLWRATHPDHGMPLVMKIPILDPGADASMIVGYETEAMIHKRLSGPHVPRFVAAGDLARIPYIAMEFVAGTRLAEALQSAPLAVAEVVRIGIAISVALADLHRQKVAHLDLKPQNVMMAKGGAVLLDFGLSRHSELPDLLGEESSAPMGTAAYIAPEQVLGDRSDPASDIFALGCILYQMATGEEPFGRPATLPGMKRRLYHAPRPPRSLRPETPAWLEEIILRCLEVDRRQRYADAAKVAFDLRHPEQVVVARHRRATTSPGLGKRILARFQKRDEAEILGPSAHARREAGPSIILVAVDLSGEHDELAAAILAETQRLLAAREDSWLACLTVLRTEIIRETQTVDEHGRSLYINRLVSLKDWARPLHLREDRVSYHVIEAVSAADAILNYAGHNDIDHVVLGARASSAVRRHLGSVSTKVVAEAHCSVSVIRVKGGRTN
ncbi:MAG TPA: bifunctional serine/threonine-protein kinase/universal stress protein [Bosea sp. (in: a-proteobacteria)]|jgi:nucleotide-binding universal stress UspA family protein|uniref:bifunctional serine/threonine-protein kinase/universal stress protein n=1 Tax=Bosea sp. (in: a-proteobacteria) TaxID=1871050 RepID=UPI002E159A6D|nr:bifunctional serine/threonine-protein kinase/universal stress protein [Bosea sp. (in: a-proteobacteria)]